MKSVTGRWDDFFVDGPTGLTGFRDVMEDPER